MENAIGLDFVSIDSSDFGLSAYYLIVGKAFNFYGCLCLSSKLMLYAKGKMTEIFH
jgi:hypothetical protein